MIRPLPHPDRLTQPFWDACRRHELVVPCCRRCGNRFFNPLPACPRCLSTEWDWQRSPGTGTLYAFSEVHRPPSPDFEVPYVLGIVDLDDGWTMLTNIVDSPARALYSDQPVVVRFVEVDGGAVLPCFAPEDPRAA